MILLDTGIDFIHPEFLNILFFQQKNLVIFPYIDLKHLHTLELFTVGYNVIDLESTALYNLKEIIEFEANNSYSQNRTFFFIYNLDTNKIKEITEIPDIRCILNTNEDIKIKINRNDFIFYNKKNKTFINYDKNLYDLTFERHLISTSENETILFEKIQKIKMVATKVFMEINKNPNFSEVIPEILQDYKPRFWDKILKFVSLFFKIETPAIDSFKNLGLSKVKINKSLKNESHVKNLVTEYEQIIALNKHIAKEFIQLLHQYRSQKVNPKNLRLEQLYNPQELYIYLRNHHWVKKIPKSFLNDWIQMQNTLYTLNIDDINDFITIFKKLNVFDDSIMESLNKKFENVDCENIRLRGDLNKVFTRKSKISFEKRLMSVKNFSEFKDSVLKRLEDIENLISNLRDK